VVNCAAVARGVLACCAVVVRGGVLGRVDTWRRICWGGREDFEVEVGGGGSEEGLDVLNIKLWVVSAVIIAVGEGVARCVWVRVRT
jgi:hypothetical protein